MEPKAHAQASERARIVRDTLRSCTLCPRRCGVDRLAGQVGYCGVDAHVRWFREVLHNSEESPLNPSHQVYFAGCNLRCEFCSVAEWNDQPQAADPMDKAGLLAVIERRRREGARTLNLLGGEPSVSLHGILDLLAEVDVRTQVVWNSNMYYGDLVGSMLEGLVDLYLADLKCGNSECARRLLDAKDYVEVVRSNILRASRKGDLIVRHVILPGHIDCCLRPTLEWIAGNCPKAKVSLRPDYVPPAQGRWAPVGYVSQAERHTALQIAGDLALSIIE